MVSIDPGEKHVGVAFWADDGSLLDAYEVRPEDLLDLLYRTAPTTVVVETFTLSSNGYSRAKAHQAAETLKLIGAIRGVGFALGYVNRAFVVHEQQPSVRHVAMRSPWWRELERPTNPHVRSAVAHGLYWLRFSKKGTAARARSGG